MNKEQELYNHFTMILSKNNLDKIETVYSDEYSIIAKKECAYSKENYMIIEFVVLDDGAYSDDLEVLLNDMGGLAIHQEGTNSFCILQEDLDELAEIFSWANSGNVLMGELLSIDDRKALLEFKQKLLGIKGDILIDLGTNDKCNYVNINNNAKDLFNFEGRISFDSGTNIETIWWPFLLEEKGGFNFVIKKEDDDNDEEPSILESYPWDDGYNDYYYDYGYFNYPKKYYDRGIDMYD